MKSFPAELKWVEMSGFLNTYRKLSEIVLHCLTEGEGRAGLPNTLGPIPMVEILHAFESTSPFAFSLTSKH